MNEHIYLLDAVINIDVLQYYLPILYAPIILSYLLDDQYCIDFPILFLKTNLVFFNFKFSYLEGVFLNGILVECFFRQYVSCYTGKQKRPSETMIFRRPVFMLGLYFNKKHGCRCES